jgi:hypothetical protein
MRVFLDLFQIQKTFKMAIYTSDHIGKWYWLKYDNNIVLAETFTSDLTRSVTNKKLIQGDAGVHVMGVNGKTLTSTLTSNVLLQIPQAQYNLNGPVPTSIIPPFNPGYKDVLDLLISDFNLIRSFLYNPNNWYMTPRNLLTSASIQISDTINCTLNYNCFYDQMFQQIAFADYFPKNFDFLARLAKNYDCRFYATENSDQMLKVLSGSININVTYTKLYIANTESEYPLYSPQGYEVSGSITVLAKNWNILRDLYNSKVVSFTNFSLLIGTRYLRLGQFLIEDKINFNLNPDMTTADISFKGYGRL